MTMGIPVLGAVATVNVLGGVVLALLVLKSQETFPKVAPLSGIAFGGIAIWSQLVVGDQLNPTFPELEALVLTAAVSALAGLVAVFSTLQQNQRGNNSHKTWA